MTAQPLPVNPTDVTATSPASASVGTDEYKLVHKEECAANEAEERAPSLAKEDPAVLAVIWKRFDELCWTCAPAIRYEGPWDFLR